MKIGRPTDFTPELAAEICVRISDGRSLRSICKASDMPDARTVFRWLAANKDFCQQYVRAREASADAMFEEMLHIADTPKLGKKTKLVDGKKEVMQGDMIEHRRLQVDARKWALARMAPKKYGEKWSGELTGKDGAPLLDAAAVEAYVRNAPDSE